MTKGILAFGAYIPWRRLPRKAIAETHGWFNPALKGQAKGERAFCNWDEDPVTMAVEAARDALAGRDRGTIGALSKRASFSYWMDDHQPRQRDISRPRAQAAMQTKMARCPSVVLN